MGTGSVGWAVTDSAYNIIKRHGKALWGIRLFESAKTAEERRIFRTSRRRTERRKNRLHLLQEIFAEEISKKDMGFYQRMKESKYWHEDKKDINGNMPELPYALFADADMENLHRNSLYGREEMMEYAGVLVRKAVQYRQYINKSDSVTSQVCAYIDAHYREEIHREELGELVFLNTDYLSRIFKKEKGISISNYIIQKRVEEAKKLLTQSTLPINTVSLYVGYSNFSYFTKMFKDNTGYAPLEYRRSFSEK